jgi:hypothetical protein
MNKLLVLAALIAVCPLCRAERAELRMSLRDRFVVDDTADWKVVVNRQLMLRFAEVTVSPKDKDTFDLTLTFRCDTPDLARFDSPAKMKQAVEASVAKYRDGIVEKKPDLEELHNRGWYGFKTKVTDASLVGKKPGAGEYRYMILGMIRLSDDSALGFRLVTNDPASEETTKLLDYINGFAKPKSGT